MTKIPNRFQVEYLDGTITRLTHISYVKKYHERCQFAERVGLPHTKRVSRVNPWARMARIRLIAGKGKKQVRMVVSCVKAINQKWPVKNGPVRVKVISDGSPLPADLQVIVDAVGPDKWIEGSVLVDLCKQRSEEEGSGCYAPEKIPETPVFLESGCDSPEGVAGPPVLHLPSPGPSIMPVGQVRQFSWRYSDKHGLSDIRQKFAKNNKQIHSSSLFPPSQAPLVSKVHLLRVTRKVKQQERTRGEHLSVSLFKSLSKGERNVTSSSIPAKSERDKNVSYSVKYNAGEGNNSPKHLYKDNKHVIDNCELQEKEKERENFYTGRLSHDEIIASSKCDVTSTADCSVEQLSSLVARKRFLPLEDSILSSISNSRKCWMAFKGIVSLLVIRLIMILGILVGTMKISRSEGKRLIGTPMECVSSEELGNVGTSFPFSIFLECLMAILVFPRELFNYGMEYLVWGRNKIGTEGRKRLRSFISRPMLELRNLRIGNTFMEPFMLRIGNVLETFMARERFGIYLYPFSDLCASCHIQLCLFKLNLKFRNRFKVIYEYIYLYIYSLP